MLGIHTCQTHTHLLMVSTGMTDGEENVRAGQKVGAAAWMARKANEIIGGA